MVIITIELSAKDLAGLVDLFDIFSGTGPDQAVLEPTVGAFDLAFGLRREGVTELDVDLLPLGIDVVGEKTMLSPVRVAALDEAENRAGIAVVGRGDAPA